MGKIPWNKGKPMSPEARAHLSKIKMGIPNLAQRGKKHTPDSIEKMRRAKLGTKASAETRAKQSQSHKLRNERLRSLIKTDLNGGY